MERCGSSGWRAGRHADTAGSGVTRAGGDKHLCVLAGAGLARGSRPGRESLWRLEPRRLGEARHSLDLLSRQRDEALGRLRMLVEE